MHDDGRGPGGRLVETPVAKRVRRRARGANVRNG